MHCSLWACSWCFAWVCNCFIIIVLFYFSRKRNMYAVYACMNPSVMFKRHGLTWLEWDTSKSCLQVQVLFPHVLCVVWWSSSVWMFYWLNNRKHYRLRFPCMLLCSGCHIETNLWHWETDTMTMAAFKFDFKLMM